MAKPSTIADANLALPDTPKGLHRWIRPWTT
jgi:hypothetical protein